MGTCCGDGRMKGSAIGVEEHGIQLWGRRYAGTIYRVWRGMGRSYRDAGASHGDGGTQDSAVGMEG